MKAGARVYHRYREEPLEAVITRVYKKSIAIEYVEDGGSLTIQKDTMSYAEDFCILKDPGLVEMDDEESSRTVIVPFSS